MLPHQGMRTWQCMAPKLIVEWQRWVMSKPILGICAMSAFTPLATKLLRHGKRH
jgi:hypothetical protein